MSDVVTIRHRFFPRYWAAPMEVPLDQLQVVMDTANRHFGDPDKQLGGPKIPPPEKR